MIIYIDQDPSTYKGPRHVEEDEIASTPMKAFWEGIKEAGWPSQPGTGPSKGLRSVLSTKREEEFSESSFAVLSKEYMVLSLRMGYHFNSVEALCTDAISKNYIRFQCKGGGAALDRRSRRICVLKELLSSMGFEHNGKGDFINAKIAYLKPSDGLAKLRLLGRITMMTKQLDMVLSNDSITEWYIQDFKKGLGLTDVV
uniref:Protein related to phosphoenolpyruvate synthase n=1 Tax=uncultured sulfate-reducing bacterium TaxID=153939 RepID=Q3IBN3_9BACT|nr:Protein related to phosphoenolpyruvate synthase [uncultured sulfate-reducing bacterium]